jgi:RnfABCDGE-type electron transport complex B subunit
MIEITIGIAAGTMLGMAVIMSYILGWANKKFHVEVDARVEAVIEALPGANCGGCGFLGCSEYAVAIVTDNAPVNKCPVGGEACAIAVGAIMGVEVGETIPHRAVVHCGATLKDRLGRTEYKGERRCAAATLVAGVQGCTFGCLGFGDCVEACKYDAIHVEDGLAVVNYDHCIGCGACVKACPTGALRFGDKKEMLKIAYARVKELGGDASVYGDTFVDGTHMIYVLPRKAGVYDRLPEKPRVPFSVSAGKDWLKPLSLLAAGGVIGGAFLHYITHGPKDTGGNGDQAGKEGGE